MPTHITDRYLTNAGIFGEETARLLELDLVIQDALDPLAPTVALWVTELLKDDDEWREVGLPIECVLSDMVYEPPAIRPILRHLSGTDEDPALRKDVMDLYDKVSRDYCGDVRPEAAALHERLVKAYGDAR